MKEEIENILNRIQSLLKKNEEENPHLRRALAGDDQDLWSFLVSNELWGGAGSIADQGALANNRDRKLLENLLIDLGKIQIDAKKLNERTEMWVQVFRVI